MPMPNAKLLFITYFPTGETIEIQFKMQMRI